MNTTIESIIDSAGLGSVQKFRSVSGGSINEAFEVETDSETFFLKVNSASRHPSMFETESAGLYFFQNPILLFLNPSLLA